jgi:hypothetical protein
LLAAALLAGAITCGGSPTRGQPAADDDASPNFSPSLNYGVTDFNYYSGPEYLADQEFLASHVDLAIIGQGDAPMTAAWQQIHADGPRGKWLDWRTTHLFYTNDVGGTCAAPTPGAASSEYAQDTQRLAAFLAANPQYGDGESCFLHAQNDGRIQATWQCGGCQVTLQQKGLSGGAKGVLKDARLWTIVYDGYTWLFNLASPCAQDLAAWQAEQFIQQGLSGEGYDNLGSPTADGYYLPALLDPIDIVELPASAQTSVAAEDGWYYPTVAAFLTAVRDKARAVNPGATIVFNGAAYCSWDGSTAQQAALANEGVGVWCENALQVPSEGPLGTADRLQALIGFSQALAAKGSFLALETFYNDGANPTAPEIMFFLAAYYNFKNGQDALIVRPSWSPYEPFMDTSWFAVFGRDVGQPLGPSTAGANGVFSRAYRNSLGQTILVLVRADGTNPAVPVALAADYCSVGADNTLTPLNAGTLTMNSGDGYILIERGTGGCNC